MKTAKKKDSKQSIITSFKSYSLTLYILVLLSGLIFGVLNLNSLIQGNNADNITNTAKTPIDASTINILKSMPISNVNASSQTLPSGRINPFAE
jgi:hypothetical protein